MKKEEKVYLLYELLGQSLPQQIAVKREELLRSPTYVQLKTKMQRIKASPSYRAQSLYLQFRAIRIKKLNTMKDLLVAEATIHHLLFLFEKKIYVNPFFYDEQIDQCKHLGQLSFLFDDKVRLMNDVILDERYAMHYKIDAIKQLTLRYRKEIKETLFDNIILFKTRPKNLPTRHLWNKFEIVQLILLILFHLVAIAPLFLSQNLMYDIVHGFHAVEYFSIPFYFSYLFLFLYDVYFLLHIMRRKRKISRYLFAHKILLHQSSALQSKMDQQTERLYDVILEGITKKEPIAIPLKKFACFQEELKALGYLKRLNEKSEPMLEERIETLAVFFLELVIIVFLIVTALYFLIQGGILK